MENNRPKKINYVNYFELTVSLKEDPIQTNLDSGIGSLKVKVAKCRAQWEGLNYTTLSVYPTDEDPSLVTKFLKLKQNDVIKVIGKIYNRYMVAKRRTFFVLEVKNFEKISRRKKGKNMLKKKKINI